MLLDESMVMYHRDPIRRKVDWVFSLTGFIFLFFAFIVVLFDPFKRVEMYCFETIIVIPYYFVLIGTALLFFLLGGLYALINRGLQIKTDYKLSVMHLGLSITAVLALLWKMSYEEVFVAFYFVDLFTSSISITAYLIFTQIIFFINALLGVVKKR